MILNSQSEEQLNSNELSVLYELSLSIGTSLDFKENCKNFFNALISLLDIKDVKLYHEKQLYLVSRDYNNVIVSTMDNLAIKNTLYKLEENEFTFYAEPISPLHIAKNLVLLFKITNNGFIKITAKNDRHQFNQSKLIQLNRIIKKFDLSLQGCILKDEENQINLFDPAKLDEKEFSQSLSRLKFVLDSTPDKIFAVDKEYRLLMFNKACTKLMHKLFGIKKLEIGTLLLPNNEMAREQWRGYYERALNGENVMMERSYTVKGELRYDLVNITPVRNEIGEIIGLTLFGKEITEFKNVEEQFFNIQDRLSLVFESSLDAMITIDTDGTILEWNDAAEQIFGYSPNYILGKNIMNFILNRIEKNWFANMIEHLKEKKVQTFSQKRFEVKTKHKSGKILPIELSITSFEIQNKSFLSLFIRDLTAKKEAEEKKEQLLHELGKVNNELKDFAYIVSHDLKAPLRAIGSLTSWIIQDYSHLMDEKGKEHLTLLKGRVIRLHNFIEAILQYSRIGRIKVTQELTDLNELVKNVIDSLFVPEDFEITIVNPLPKITCEKIRIEQVFQNLIINAIKYNDKKKGIIKIDWEERDSYYIISVADNGPGIPEKYQEKIFKIFQTLQARDKFESTGVGLTIVKRIVENQGGSITVKSIEKEGTTFEFTLLKNHIQN